MKWLILAIVATAFAGCTDSNETQSSPSFILEAPPIQYGPANWISLQCDLSGAKEYGLNAVPIDAWRVEPMAALEWFAGQVSVELPQDLGFEHGLHLVTDLGNVTFAPDFMRYYGPTPAFNFEFDGNMTDWSGVNELLQQAGATPDMELQYTAAKLANTTTLRVTQTYQNHTVFVGGNPAEFSATIIAGNESSFAMSMSKLQRTFYGLTLMPTLDAREIAQATGECLSFQEVAGRPSLQASSMVALAGLHVVHDSLSFAFEMYYDTEAACEAGRHVAQINVDAFTGAVLRHDLVLRPCA